MSKRSVLMEKCGLPETYETSHCFNDSTHQTCCHLGPEARKYADNSGNPIGKASLKAFYDKNNRHAKDDELTPWCTCFGSKVCSYYADKFNDGTHIEFLNDMKTNDVLKNIPNKVGCEDWSRKSLDIVTHNTPGIIGTSGDSCSKDDIKSIIRETIYNDN